jgi:hypothetical protein
MLKVVNQSAPHPPKIQQKDPTAPSNRPQYWSGLKRVQDQLKTPWKDSAMSDGLETIGVTTLLLGFVFLSTVHPSNPLLVPQVGRMQRPPDWIMWPTHPIVIGGLSLIVFMFVRDDKAKLKLLSQFQIGFTLAIGFASLWLFYRR